MLCRFLFFSISILLYQVSTSVSIRIKHPALWENPHVKLLFKPDRNQRNSNWNYVASAHRTMAYKRSLIIQNFDGSILRYEAQNKSFSLVSSQTENSLHNQMFVLTLNLQAVQLENQNDSRIMQIIRSYIPEESKSKRNFILIRAVYWPYYLCYNPDTSVYGAVIENDTLSHDCIWYRIITPSGYMKILKLNRMPFDNITYHDSRALTSYPKNHLSICVYNTTLDNSFHWAVSLSHLFIPLSRIQRSVFLKFPNRESSKIKWIFDRLKDLQRSIIPAVCLELDRKVHYQIKYMNRVFNRIDNIKDQISKKYSNLSNVFVQYLDILPIAYREEIIFQNFHRNLKFFQQNNLNNINRTKQKIKEFETHFLETIRKRDIERFRICKTIINRDICLCIFSTDHSKVITLCKTFQFDNILIKHFAVWSQLPTENELFLAQKFHKRYLNATSITDRRRAFFSSNSNKMNSYNNDFSRSQICL